MYKASLTEAVPVAPRLLLKVKICQRMIKKRLRPLFPPFSQDPVFSTPTGWSLTPQRTRAQLARGLGLDEKEVRRMLSPRRPTKLLRIEQALAALGRHLVLSLETEAA